MSDISVIILTGNEERHIWRCLERLVPLAPRQIFVVESQQGNRTHALIEEFAAQSAIEVKSVFRDWPGNQAAQFNWAIDNLPLVGEWVLRLDADEYLTNETILRIAGGLPADADALTLELKRKFLGGEIRHATNGIRQVRLFRRGHARYPNEGMDERLAVEGKIVDFNGAFYDDSLMPLAEWREKHLAYARREAAQAVASMKIGEWTDPRKAAYYSLPRYLRAILYFLVRYLFKGGILDGRAGWRWNFWQALWYRWLVDREIGRISIR